MPWVQAQAVAKETARIWCSLAERLGMFATKVGSRPHSRIIPTRRYQQLEPGKSLTASDGLLQLACSSFSRSISSMPLSHC